MGRPRSYGKTVTPSGRFPSECERPLGSRTVTKPAAASAARMRSLTSLCRAPRPTPRSQLTAWSPLASSGSPHTHVPSAATGRFRRRPTEMEKAASGNRMPSLVFGVAVKRHADSGADAASNRATSRCVDSLPRSDSSLHFASGFNHAKVLV